MEHDGVPKFLIAHPPLEPRCLARMSRTHACQAPGGHRGVTAAIAYLERGSQRRQPLPFGVPLIDEHLPGHGLARGTLHEIIEAGAASEFAGAATLFTAGIAARLKGPVLWCLTRRNLFAPGLLRAGLHPDRVIYVETFHDRDILPLVEEGLHEKGLGAVVGEVTRLGLTASRRVSWQRSPWVSPLSCSGAGGPLPTRT